jgi:AcrR family transcriptional regulator
MVQEINEHRSNNFPHQPARPATALRHEGLRQQLVAAALRMIEAEGLPALRARDLAKSAGCSLGAIYNIFADLDELILEVNAETLQAIGAVMAATGPLPPLARFLAMADAYVTYAAANRLRWDALFTHRLPAGTAAPDWFLAVRETAFSHIEGPLALLCPALATAELALLGRSIFAAVHGMVALGLDKRLAPTDLPALRGQIAAVVTAIARGL